MSETVYVIGHKNPDTDSICSAIAYAYLKNHIESEHHIPARLGKINRETEFVLNYFNLSPPELIPHVKIRVKDVMTSPVITARPHTPIRKIGELLYTHGIKSIPIVDEDQRLLGIVTERDMAHRYIEEIKIRSLKDISLEISKIVQTLDGKLIVGDAHKLISGNVLIGAMLPQTMVNYIVPGDIIIVGNRERAQKAALQRKVSCLVITGNFDPSPEIVQLARDRGAAIITTPHDTYAAARLINLSIPSEKIMQREIFTVEEEDLLSEVTEDVMASEYRQALVIDSGNRLMGILTRSDLVNPIPRKVILVDHNEIKQSADGIEQANILEIIDHHRLGDVQTKEPVLVINKPVGSTATIIWRRFGELGVEIPREIAGILMASILSDTVLFKSPTTTEEDKMAAEELAKIAGIEDPIEFGIRMCCESSEIVSMKPKDLIFADFKTYNFGDLRVGIGQVETIDSAIVLKNKDEILQTMEQIRLDKELDILALMLTDIMKEGTELLAVGRTKFIEKAFGRKLEGGKIFLPGVISRKKQVGPPLAKAIG
ncbi:MAG: putative manganese-dependent inorganic diphosphatase [Actinomycetota bacterium]